MNLSCFSIHCFFKAALTMLTFNEQGISLTLTNIERSYVQIIFNHLIMLASPTLSDPTAWT